MQIPYALNGNYINVWERRNQTHLNNSNVVFTGISSQATYASRLNIIGSYNTNHTKIDRLVLQANRYKLRLSCHF